MHAAKKNCIFESQCSDGKENIEVTSEAVK
jgi:hypothetical protein